MKRRDDIKTFIVISIVCIFCVGIVLIFNFKNNFDKLEPVEDYNIFFTNVTYVNQYFNYIATFNKNAVYDLLDNKYINDNEVTYDNVLNIVDNYNVNSSFSADVMKFVKIGNNFIYYVEGKIYENVFEGKNLIDDNFSIIIMTDTNNSSYSLYPIYDNNYKDIINKIRRIKVKDNDYNHITQSDNIDKEQICVIYLADFFDNITMNINESYNLLSDNMKKIYITNDSYSKYINDNINKMSFVADKCKLQDIDNKNVYSVIDTNGNRYVFTEESVMDYKIDFYLNEASE